MADFLSKLSIDSTEHMIRGCGIPYGVVDSTSTSTAFTVTVPGINELKNGVIILLKNGVVTSASGFTININGLGAKPVYSNMAAATAETTLFNVNYTMLFVYDETRVSGGAWICYRGYYSDTTTARGYNDYYFRPYAGSAVYRYKFLMEGADHRLYPITTTNQSSATQVTKSPQTVGLRPWKIWYYNTTGTVNAGAAFGAQTIAPAVYLTTAVYNFHASTGTYKWIYLVGSYNKDTDLFTLDSSTTGYYLFVSQNVTPSTSTFTTGKYYILLGASYSTTNYVQLFNVNPFYYFDGTHLIPVESKIAKDEAAAAVQSLDSSISATTGQAISAITITDGKITDSSKISVPTVTDTYSSTSSNAMSGKAVNAALQTLDSSITATTGQAISAITITDGKISANSKINVGETNQNAFSNFKVDSTTISASSKTDTFEFYAGQNITITADATNKKITIDADADSSVYIVHASSTINGGTITYTTDADWDDAYDTLLNGGSAILRFDTTNMSGTTIVGGNDYYVVEFNDGYIKFQNHDTDLAAGGSADRKVMFTWTKTTATVLTRDTITSMPATATIPTVTDTYSSTSSDAMSGKAVNAALQTLDSSISATTGQAISAITITDGKIASSSKVSVGETNQNAFSGVKIDTTTISAGSKTDTIEFYGGENVNLTADTTNKKVTIDVDVPTVTDTYSSTSSDAMSGKAVNAALQTLDSSITATTGQAISAITITDGKIASSSKISVGTVTSVGLSNVSGESDFTIANSPVTSSGTITIKHANSITAGTAGTSSATSGSTLAVPYVTYDKHGHVTASGTHTHTVTGFATEDTKVTNTLGTTTKYYVTGTTSSSTNTGTQYFDTGIYSTTTAGQLNATTYKVNENVTLQWNSTDSSLDFIF